MFIERLPYGDGWLVTDIVNGYLVTRRYFFYTKKEAVALFKEETKPQ